jgi:hypothetical protein
MVFLAFDASCQATNQKLLDLNPKTPTGQNQRQLIELEYTKLVFLGNANEGVEQIIELGKADTLPIDPGKRFSSNFLTVPLKKASESEGVYDYPRRPKTPLMKMGEEATGHKWGITHHGEWKRNLPKLFEDIRGSTFFTDLAVFVNRDTNLGNPVNLSEGLKASLSKRFTIALAEFWCAKIDRERPLVSRHFAESALRDHYSPCLISNRREPVTNIERLSRGQLIQYCIYLKEKLRSLGQEDEFFSQN